MKEHLNSVHDKRFKQHLHFWIRKLDSAGLKPEMEIVQAFPEDENGERELCEAEIRLIADLRKDGIQLTNKHPGGKGKATRGYTQKVKRQPISEETRKKMRLRKLGRPSPRRGAKISDETREKLRVSHTGKKMAVETRLKMSETHREIWKRRKTCL